MKLNISIFLVVALLIVESSMAQVSPIKESISQNNYRMYKCDNYDITTQTLKNQINLNNILAKSNMKVVFDSTFDKNFITTSISTDNYNQLKRTKTLFRITYIIDQDGNTLSCALRIKNNEINFSRSEIESILNNAINHKFLLTDIPSGVSTFYHLINVPFGIK